MYDCLIKLKIASFNTSFLTCIELVIHHLLCLFVVLACVFSCTLCLVNLSLSLDLLLLC